MTESFRGPFAPFIYLDGNQISRIWNEFLERGNGDQKTFLDSIEPVKRMQYTAALNAKAALDVSDIDVSNVRKVGFTRGMSRRLMLDINFCDSYPTEIACIDFQLGNIPQIPFPISVAVINSLFSNGS